MRGKFYQSALFIGCPKILSESSTSSELSGSTVEDVFLVNQFNGPAIMIVVRVRLASARSDSTHPKNLAALHTKSLLSGATANAPASIYESIVPGAQRFDRRQYARAA